MPKFFLTCISILLFNQKNFLSNIRTDERQKSDYKSLTILVFIIVLVFQSLYRSFIWVVFSFIFGSFLYSCTQKHFVYAIEDTPLQLAQCKHFTRPQSQRSRLPQLIIALDQLAPAYGQLLLLTTDTRRLHKQFSLYDQKFNLINQSDLQELLRSYRRMLFQNINRQLKNELNEYVLCNKKFIYVGLHF